MCTGPKSGLEKGETVPGTLTVEFAETAKFDFAVGGIGDQGPGGAARAHAGHPMPGTDMDWGVPP